MQSTLGMQSVSWLQGSASVESPGAAMPQSLASTAGCRWRQRSPPRQVAEQTPQADQSPHLRARVAPNRVQVR